MSNPESNTQWEDEELCAWCSCEPPTPGYFDADGDPICKGCLDDAVMTMGWDTESTQSTSLALALTPEEQ